MDNSLKKGRITNFSNKIGLFDPEKQTFINGSGDVVLSFPFKDCVLEGGMSDEEAGREEKFFHETLDRADIDTLRDPKVLTKFEKIDKDGIRTIMNPSEIDFWDENGELKENLLIKGNNLIALYSLRQKLAGKVKLIYIDPPYNTGSDGFRYNDNFNHSTWLVFMRNRLEIARELLREDGVIFVQCDDNEQAYLKILLDEVFGRDSFINCIVAQMSNLSGHKIEHAIQGRKFPKIKEYILLYSKNKTEIKLKIPKVNKAEWDEEYNLIIPNMNETEAIEMEEWIEDKDFEKVNKYFSDKNIVSLKEYSKQNQIELSIEWKNANSYKIFASKPNTALRNKAMQFDFNQAIYAIPNQRGDLKIIKTDFNRETDTARIELVSALKNSASFVGDIWYDIVTTGGVAQEGGVVMKNGKKPEDLISQIIESATIVGDVVLDYHLGSGTTSAVAHKMGRRWIGIEQMDYIEDIAKVRLQKVIEGEQGGISKSVEWQGGGSFVYMELKAYNIEFIDRIESARTKDELHVIYVEMASNAFLQFWFDRRDWEKDESYKSLPLEEQKVKLRELLDLNQLYLNVGDMNDSRHHVSALEKALTEKFYGKE